MLYCNLNKNNPLCSCVIPPNNISIISKNFFQPYYCWYGPCFISNYFKTNYIHNQQLNCNSTNCQINIGDINIDANNKITISNNCATSLAKNIYIKEDEYTFKPLSIIILNLKYILLIISSFLLFISH